MKKLSQRQQDERKFSYDRIRRLVVEHSQIGGHRKYRHRHDIDEKSKTQQVPYRQSPFRLRKKHCCERSSKAADNIPVASFERHLYRQKILNKQGPQQDLHENTEDLQLSDRLRWYRCKYWKRFFRKCKGDDSHEWYDKDRRHVDGKQIEARRNSRKTPYKKEYHPSSQGDSHLS